MKPLEKLKSQSERTALYVQLLAEMHNVDSNMMLQIIKASKPNKEYLFNYYKYVNWRCFIIPPTTNEYEIIASSRVNKPIFYPRNMYVLHSLKGIGGGSLSHMHKALKYYRIGGSTQDKINYIALYQDNSNINYEFKCSLESMFERHVGRKFSIMPIDKVNEYITINYGASPGCVVKNFNFKDKTETLRMAEYAFRCIYCFWCLNPDSSVRPSEIWSVAARPKLKKLCEMEDKLKEFKPCCREVSVAGPLEQFLGFPIWYPLSVLIEKKFKYYKTGIAIGINRMGNDWVDLYESIKGAKSVYVGDYSRYDQSVPVILMNRALSFIEECLDKECIITQNYKKNFFRYFRDNIINKLYNIENKVLFKVKNGVPSGTLWTSLINSIVNIIVIDEAMTHLKIKSYEPVVYGDDHIILLYDEIDGDKFRRDFLNFTESHFGIVGNPDDAVFCTPDMYCVKYERPVFKPGNYLEKGTSFLKPLYIEESDEPFESFDYSKGTTHRWNYTFKNRVKFLQYYFLPTGLAIRPLQESLIRLINPENVIHNINDHKNLIISHLFDNFNNAHVRNHMYHLYYDACHMSRHFDWEKNRLDENQKLMSNPYAFNSFKESKIIYGSRLWYRRIDKYVNLFEEKCMEEFNKKWFSILDIAEKINTSTTSVPFYARKNIIIEMIKRNLSSYEEIQMFYTQKGYKKGLNSEFARAFIDKTLNEKKENMSINSKMTKFVLPVSLPIIYTIYSLLPSRMQLLLSLYNKSDFKGSIHLEHEFLNVKDYAESALIVMSDVLIDELSTEKFKFHIKDPPSIIDI